MANDCDTSPAADPIALTARLMALLPRLALAMSQAGYRQMREMTGLDYSLIDYQGVLAAAGRFAPCMVAGPASSPRSSGRACRAYLLTHRAAVPRVERPGG